MDGLSRISRAGLHGARSGVTDSGGIGLLEPSTADFCHVVDAFGCRWWAAVGKPIMIYLSDRPIAPSAINLGQLTKLTSFKSGTMKSALVGSFASISELKTRLARDLHGQVLSLQLSGRKVRMTKLDGAARMTELMVTHKQRPAELSANMASEILDGMISIGACLAARCLRWHGSRVPSGKKVATPNSHQSRGLSHSTFLLGKAAARRDLSYRY